jgi:hypothetical protein
MELRQARSGWWQRLGGARPSAPCQRTTQVKLAVFAIMAGCCLTAPHRPRLANGSFRHRGSESRSREGLAFQRPTGVTIKPSQ